MKKLLYVLGFIILCCVFIACTEDLKLKDSNLLNKSSNTLYKPKNEVIKERQHYLNNAKSGFALTDRLFSSMEDSRDM